MFQHLVVNKVGTYLMLIRWDMWWSWWTPDVWTWPCLKREMSNYFCVSSHIISAHVSSINIMISSMIYSQRVVNSTGVFTCTVPVRTSSYPRCWNGDVAGRRSSRILSSAAIFFEAEKTAGSRERQSYCETEPSLEHQGALPHRNPLLERLYNVRLWQQPVCRPGLQQSLSGS